MSTWINMIFYRFLVSNEPILPQTFQDVPFQHHDLKNIIIKFSFSVRFALRSRSGTIQTITSLSQLSSHYISFKQFFQHTPAILRSRLSHQLLQPDKVDKLIPRIMLNARLLLKNHPRNLPSNVKDVYVAYPLFVDVIAEFPETEEFVTAIEGFVGESMQQVRMIPASEEAIKSLNTVKFQENVGDDTQQIHQCCICLQDFQQGMELLTMPCHHVYHNDCIVWWLKANHSCPLCRYPMPVADDS